jgi:hypothetical protein
VLADEIMSFKRMVIERTIENFEKNFFFSLIFKIFIDSSSM